MHGVLLVDKSPGLSSFAVLENIQKLIPGKRREKPKMGHGGTLDPFATGLLLVCVGEATKLSRYFLDSRKRYTGTIEFGRATASGDLTDAVTATSDLLPDDLAAIQVEATAIEKSEYLQTPPMHSAIKQGGRPLYELARQGIEVERQARRVTLKDFEMVEYTRPNAQFGVECSGGTYIRVLAQDLAARLGTVAHLTALRRTGSGSFDVKNSTTLDQLAETDWTRWTSLAAWVDFDQMLADVPALELDAKQARAVIDGKKNALDFPQLRTRAVFEGRLIAVLNEGRIERVFPPALRS